MSNVWPDFITPITVLCVLGRAQATFIYSGWLPRCTAGSFDRETGNRATGLSLFCFIPSNTGRGTNVSFYLKKIKNKTEKNYCTSKYVWYTEI